MSSIAYSFGEAAASLWRGRQSGLLATATIAVALFVLGAFLIVTANLERLGTEWRSAGEMSVFLADDITPEHQQAIEAAVQTGPGNPFVASHEYVSKNEAMKRFKQTFGELAPAIDGLGENPLPASFNIRLKGSVRADSDSEVERLASRIRDMPGVSDVRYDEQWLNRLLSAVDIIRAVGLTLGTLLTIAAALTVANVVRLALYARRDELEIMQLVGAPQAYIRGPFVVEGLLQGGIGAMVALAALGVVYGAFRARYLTPLASAINLSSVRFLPVELWLLLVAGGMAVGCIGGLVAAWRS